MALANSDVTWLQKQVQQHLVTRWGSPAVALTPSTSEVHLGASLLWHKQDPLFQRSPKQCSSLPLTCDATFPPLWIGVHFIQQVQIKLLGNIHRAGACGSPACARWACLRKTLTELLLSRVELEQDLAGHKYTIASLHADRARREKMYQVGNLREVVWESKGLV